MSVSLVKTTICQHDDVEITTYGDLPDHVYLCVLCNRLERVQVVDE